MKRFFEKLRQARHVFSSFPEEKRVAVTTVYNNMTTKFTSDDLYQLSDEDWLREWNKEREVFRSVYNIVGLMTTQEFDTLWDCCEVFCEEQAMAVC